MNRSTDTAASPAPVTGYEAHIARVLAKAPPLTAEQASRIRSLFRPGTASVPLAA